MPIDPNIALQVKPLQLNDPLAQYAQVSQIQSAQNQNELAKYTISKAKREDERTNQLLARLSGAKTNEDILNAYKLGGYGKEALGMEKDIAAIEQSKSTTGYNKARTATETSKLDKGKIVESITHIASLNSAEDAIKSIDDYLKQGTIDEQKAGALKQSLAPYLTPGPDGKMPSIVGWQKQTLGGLLDAKDKLTFETPKIREIVAADGSKTYVDENPNSPTFRQPMLAPQPAGMTPYQRGTLGVSQFNAATNRERLELQRNAPKLGLTNQDDIDAVAVAIANGKLPVDRVNSTTAPLFAKLLKANPDIDFTKLTTDQANALSAARSGGTIAGRQELTGTDKTQAQNIASGNLPPVTGPNAGKIMNEVLAIKPDYNANDYQLQTAAQKSFNTGKQGDKTRSLNVAVSHLGVLENAANALHAGNTPAINQFKQAWQRETGKIGPTSFNAVKELVADEIVAAVVPGVGSLADRKALKDTIMAKSSPAQLQGVIKQYKELLGGQLSGLEQQYIATTRKTDFKERYLLPETQRALTTAATPAATPTPPAAAARPTGVGANWTLETDSKGNRAYVSPDRKSFKEVP